MTPILYAANAASFFGFSRSQNVKLFIANNLAPRFSGHGNKALRRMGLGYMVDHASLHHRTAAYLA